MPLRPCLDCGTPTPAPRRRCLDHERANRRTWQERQHSLHLRQQWVATHGLYCPGLAGRPPHPVTAFEDLTEHHVVPRSKGGRGGQTTVACRSCNSAQGDRDDAADRSTG